MAVTYQTIGAVTFGTDTSAETAAPAGVVSGDLLLLALAIRSASVATRRTPTTPTGWTFINSVLDPSGAVGDQYVYRRIAAGTGDDTPTVTLSGVPDGWQTRIIRLDGHDPTTPVQTSATATGDGGSNTSAIPVATVDRGGSIAFCCAVKLSGGTNYTIVWPTGWTKIYNDHVSVGFRSTASGGYDPVDAGTMASGQNTSGWTTDAQTVQRVTVIVQPPLPTPIGKENAWWCPSLDPVQSGTTVANLISGAGITLTGATWVDDTANGGTKAINFNGTDQYGQVTWDLAAFNAIDLSWWMYWPSFANDNDLAFEFSPNFNNVGVGFIVNPNAASGFFNVGVKGNVGYSNVNYTRPSVGWHHYVARFDKAAASEEVNLWIDGILQTPDSRPFNVNNTNNFASEMLNVGSRNGTTLFGEMKLDDIRICNPILTSGEITSLASMRGFEPAGAAVEAEVAPVTVQLTVATITPSIRVIAAASPASIAISVPAITPTVRVTASVAPVSIALSTPTVTPTYRVTASVSPATVAFSVPSITSVASGTAIVSPVTIAFSIPAITAVTSGAASVSPVSIQIDPVPVTATFRVAAIVTPVSITITPPSVTPAIRQTGIVTPHGIILALPVVSAALRVSAQVSPAAVSFATPSVSASTPAGSTAWASLVNTVLS